MQRKYKYATVLMLCVVTILGVVGGLKVINMPNENQNEEPKPVNAPISSEVLPVTNTSIKLMKPFSDAEVKIGVDFYDDNAENQEKSIIIADRTYLQNIGVLYTSDNEYDVLCILDGNVTEVGKNDIIGNYVKITHSNDIESLYQIVDNIEVKKGDYVKSGEKIGTSSTSTISPGNLLLFELLIDGKNVNPESYYNKTIEEI